tara:strand:- start:118 stop:351 length:234 start_codon:yes stop_codon:yes gene_type:complete
VSLFRGEIKMTTREEILRMKKELVAKENEIVAKERTKKVNTNLAPIQHSTKRPQPKTGEVPNVYQHSRRKKMTENKW